MAKRIEISIDLTKINKSKIREKDGRKFYNMTLIERINDKYNNNWMVVEQQSKEERDERKNGTILGNGKNYGWGESSSSNTKVSSDDLPY